MKKALVLILLAFSATTYAQKADSTEVDAEKLADLIVNEAKRHIGKRYSYGGTGAYGFDCSGLTYTVYRKFGYTLSRSSKGQANDGRAVTGPISELQKGDIIIFGSRRRSKTVGHVGIFIEIDSTGTDFKFIHSSSSGGVQISKMKDQYFDGRFLGARRLIPDFIATDTTKKDYGFDTGNTVIKPDTLALKDSESRIVILEGGKWAYVSSDGHLTEPAGEGKIVLDCSSGNWTTLKTATRLIPTSSATPAPTRTTTEATTVATDTEAVYHTLKSGDSLYSLSKKYHTTVNAICQLNGITTKTVIRVGRKLRVK